MSSEGTPKHSVGWRDIKAEDIKRGTVVRLVGLEAYNDCTIIGFASADGLFGEINQVIVARPMVFANENYDDSQPMTYCEVIKIERNRMIKDADRYLVKQDRDNVRSMLT